MQRSEDMWLALAIGAGIVGPLSLARTLFTAIFRDADPRFVLAMFAWGLLLVAAAYGCYRRYVALKARRQR
jgi:hypothetical protein